jgi:hypothetical protein
VRGAFEGVIREAKIVVNIREEVFKYISVIHHKEINKDKGRVVPVLN